MARFLSLKKCRKHDHEPNSRMIIAAIIDSAIGKERSRMTDALRLEDFYS